ncbi:MAG: hypothetical protein GY903_09755 [Fuerstiella sp.]|nr:hypothetical protein [Fuerstiella sp.]MCP4854764.1 hypothetical protein [Fuerstiella sp.]
MKKHAAVLFAVFLALVGYISPASAEVHGLSAFCREGQTFLSWQEDGSDWYYVYASDKPLNQTRGVKWIARIPRGSNRFRFPNVKHQGSRGRVYKKLFQGKPWSTHIQIEDAADASKCLPDGTGLFVRTLKGDRQNYYAVTSQEGADVRAGVSSLANPVMEKQGLPGANLIYKEEHLHYFVYFTDFDVWNSDGIDDHMHGYAHVFTASIPTESILKPAPLTVRLHAYSAWGGVFMPYSYPINRGVSIALIDYSLTWWFGHGENLKQLGDQPAGKVVNYAEQRVTQVTRWVVSNPKSFPAEIDPERVYVMGGSMGGSGANHITCKQGDLFTSGSASKGYSNWSLPPDITPFPNAKRVNVWLGDFESKYGSLNENLPTNLEGKRVYDVLNLASWVSDPRADVGYLETGNGTADAVIPFWGVATFWDALEKGKHPYSSAWIMQGHSGRLGSGAPNNYYMLRSDESIPALANASCNSPIEFGYRILGRIEEVLPDGIRVSEPFTLNVKGMRLVVGVSYTRENFKIKSVEGDIIRVVEGNPQEVKTPPSAYQMGELRRKLKREPTAEEIKAQADKNKQKYLITDGSPFGVRNGHIAWSTSLQNFDEKTTADDIVDTKSEWGMNFRLQPNYYLKEWKEDTASVDITPRRCQSFQPAAGTQVHWENWDYSKLLEPAKVAEGDVTVDQYGLVTIPNFLVCGKGLGNRLVLTASAVEGAQPR